MKNRKWMFVLVLLFSCGSFAKEGTEHGNGGELFASYYSISARIGLKSIMRDFPSLLTRAQIASLRNLIATASVKIAEHRLCYDGGPESCSPRNALIGKNYPDRKEIEVNTVGFFQLSATTRVQNALHEYLGLMGVENFGTPISSQVKLSNADAELFVDRTEDADNAVVFSAAAILQDLGIPNSHEFRLIANPSLFCNLMGYQYSYEGTGLSPRPTRQVDMELISTLIIINPSDGEVSYSDFGYPRSEWDNYSGYEVRSYSDCYIRLPLPRK
jgi:hypothetical protein